MVGPRDWVGSVSAGALVREMATKRDERQAKRNIDPIIDGYDRSRSKITTLGNMRANGD